MLERFSGRSNEKISLQNMVTYWESIGRIGDLKEFIAIISAIEDLGTK